MWCLQESVARQAQTILLAGKWTYSFIFMEWSVQKHIMTMPRANFYCSQKPCRVWNCIGGVTTAVCVAELLGTEGSINGGGWVLARSYRFSVLVPDILYEQATVKGFSVLWCGFDLWCQNTMNWAIAVRPEITDDGIWPMQLLVQNLGELSR